MVLMAGQGSTVYASDRDAKLAVPEIAGEYVTVYRPDGDRFPGPSTPELTAGEFYAEWVPNDHAIIKGPDNCWHAFGITHPLTSTENVHEGEFQSFHAIAPPGPLSEVMREGVWRDRPKVLPPSQRPGEILENHAPCIILLGDEYRMIYGPSPLRWASSRSRNLEQWKPLGAMEGERSGGRDPHLLHWQGTWYLLYCVADRVESRTSTDLRTWTEPCVILTMPRGVAPESPCLVRHHDTFYLFVCGWDGIWDRQSVQGAYQHVTYVYQSDDPLDFRQRDVVTRVAAHAPEVFCDEAGDWYISSAQWPQRGVSIARLVWR
jgi:beta-fructofuranosidase